MEARRLQAARLFARGESQVAVAKALGVTRVSAHHWFHVWKAQGRAGLKGAGRAGRKPRLDAAQLAGVERALRNGPRAHGFSTDLWTLPRVAEVIERLTRVRHHPGHVWRLLRRLGWSLQRPTRTRRTGDRDLEDAALAAAKKNARRRRAWIVFEDESGLSQQPVVCRTWAPRGETPVLTQVGGHWKRLSVAGALAFRWDGRRARFFFQTQPGSYTDRPLIVFLRDLKRHFWRRPVILIWDGLAAHKSARMCQYLAQQRAWLRVERLPGYAPELNPVELVWGNLKRRELANVCAPTLDALRTPLRRGCTRVRRHPRLAFNFLRHAGLNFKHDR
jgi:transposase